MDNNAMRHFTSFILSLLFICSASILFAGKGNALPKLKEGKWTGNLLLDSSAIMYFKFDVTLKDDGTYRLTVINADEKIELTDVVMKNDSLHAKFPFFNSAFVWKVSKKGLFGYWQNFQKGENYRVPCSITYGDFYHPLHFISTFYPPSNIDGTWAAIFDPGTTDAYPAVGSFKQNGQWLSGTFLTETGDYRFLEGVVLADSMVLSCLDGTHAWMFTGRISGDTIRGHFYSGKHWKGEWMAVRNEKATLPDPDTLTKIENLEPFSFTLNDVTAGAPYGVFSFPSEEYKNKVTIIQIMGSWCPNCLDETRYFLSLYEKYHAQGLEIIAVAYETGKDPVQHIERIKQFQKKLNIPYQIVVGGTSSKALASEHFSMLTDIVSFPTAVFIGRDGQVKKVHTGFSGPGTGAYYMEYTEETERFIQELLQEK
jgi:thiol-disulfide isomerase/thioredoxin